VNTAPWHNRLVSDDPVLDAFRRGAEDRVRGAAEIERALLSDLLALRSRWTEDGLAAGAELLAAGQQAMGPLVGLAERITDSDLDGLQSFVEHRLNALERAPEILAAGARPWIEPASLVVGVSRSSAVAGAIRAAWEDGWTGTVVVLDGSSAGGGSGQARELNRHGRAISQPDAAAQRWLDTPGALVAVGADAIGSERFVNCIGTRALLDAAVARDRPVIVIADRGKDVSETRIDAILEEVPVHRDRSGREWPLFEAIPLDLVTARISD
jgi:translation initiation factor 2B subunit (eIF-2B alpha/beta/delta family)